jgi:hypothetical protein
MWDEADEARGKHPDKALTAARVRALKDPGRYADGNGLHLVVDSSGAKRWILRTVIQGRRSDIGLGGVSLVSLASFIRQPRKIGGIFDGTRSSVAALAR